MPQSFERLLYALEFDKEQREAVYDHITTWEELVAKERVLRMYAYSDDPEYELTWISKEQAHKLYAAIWFANDRITDENKVKYFKFRGSQGFTKYYENTYLSNNGLHMEFPRGMTSEDESDGDFGDERKHDKYEKVKDESTEQEGSGEGSDEEDDSDGDTPSNVASKKTSKKRKHE